MYYNVILSLVRITNLVVEMQCVLNIMTVFSKYQLSAQFF